VRPDAEAGSLTGDVRVMVMIAMAVVVGCGSEKPVAKKPAKAPEAREIVYLYRVLGDDPMPDRLSLRADGTAEVIHGGGGSGFRTYEVEVSHKVTARAARLAETAPWKKLEGHTVTPGGFGGWDNDMRYMLRRGDARITVSAADMPRSIRPLIRQLDAIIEGDQGRRLSSTLHSPRSATIAPAAPDD
jgi:hypothetical protein